MAEHVLEAGVGWGRGEIQAHLPSWHVFNEKEKINAFPLPVPCSCFAGVYWFK